MTTPMNDWNCSFMTKDEYNLSLQNPIAIIFKAESKIKQLNKTLESTLAKQSTDSTNSQQLFQQLEKDFISSKKEVEQLNSQNLQLKREIQDLNSKNQELYSDSLKLKSNSIEKDSKTNVISKLYDELQEEKSNLLLIIERKDKDLKEEAESVSKLTDKLNEFIKERSELKSKLISVENDQSSNEFQISRLKQEISELRKQNEQLDDTTKKQTLNYFNEIKDLKSLNFELKMKNDQLNDQLEKLNQSNGSLNQKINDLEQMLTKIKEDVKKIKSEKLEANGQFEHELEVKQRLVTLYKENSEEYSKKIQSLQSQIDQYKEHDRKMKQDHDNSYRKMEEAYESLQEDYQRVIREYDEFKQSTAQGSKQGNVDISQMDIPVLSDNVKSRIIETTNLGTRDDIRRELLDMVQRYDDLTKLALNEKKEKRFVQEQLNFVLVEVEKKAPIIHEQNKDYQRLVKNQEKLLDSLTELQHQKDSLSLKAQAITAENQKLKNEITDLQKQICYLLKENLEQSGANMHADSGLIRSLNQSINQNHAETDQIIPDSLITFGNIEELQIRNQDLLKQVRFFQQEIQNYQELSKKLESAAKELDMLKSTRERQSEVIDSLSKQKEHWRSVAQQSSSSTNSPFIHNNGSPNDVSTGPISLNDLDATPTKVGSTVFGQSIPNHQYNSQSSQKQQEQQQQLNQSQQQFQDLKKSFELLQKECEISTKERQASEKEMFLKIESLKDVNTTLKLSLSQLEAEKSINADRLKLLGDSLKTQTTELDSYRKKCEEYTQIIINHQKSIEILNNNVQRSDELRNQAEVRLTHLKGENELLKQSESRLLEINKSISIEKISIESLLEKVNSLNTAKESSESELRKRMENDLITQDQTRISLRKELDQTKQTYKDLEISLNHQLTESRERYEKREKELMDTKENLLKLKISEQNLIQKVSTLENQLQNSENRINTLLERQSQQQSPIHPVTPQNQQQQQQPQSSISSLDLSLARSEIESLKESLNQEKENVIHYKTIAFSSDTDLSKLKEEYTRVKMELEDKLKETLEELSQSRQQQEEQKLRLNKLENFSHTHQKDIDDIVEAKNSLEKEKQTLYDKISQLTKDLEAAIDESKIQQNLYKQANENYEREIVAHAKNIKVLPQLRSDLADSRTKMNSIQNQKDIAVQELQEAKASWLQQESLFKAQMNEMEERMKDLKHHNTLLQSQIDTITLKTSQMDRVNQMMQTNNTSQLNAGDSEKLLSELREVIQIQGREQKILEVKNESLMQESIRLKQSLQYSQNTIDQLNQQIQQDQENMKNLTVSSWKHEEVLKQLEQMNLFKESNVMLKDETKRLNQMIEELRKQVQERDQKLVPVTQENRRLQSENQVLQQEIEAQKLEIANWSNKAQKLLNKYQSIDPDEHQKLVEQNETLTQELKTLNTTTEELRKQFEDVKKHAKHWKEESKKLGNIKKEKLEIETQNKTLEQQMNTQIQSYKQQLEKAQETVTTNQENFDKQLLELKKKNALLERIKKPLAQQPGSVSQQDHDLVKTEMESLKKTNDDKDKELNIIRMKLKVLERMNKNAPQVAQSSTTAATSTTTATTSTPVIAATATTPTTTTTATTSTPVIAATATTTATTQAVPVPTEPVAKKRLIKKPALSQLQTMLSQPTTTTTTSTTTPITPTTTTTTPLNASTTPGTTPSSTTPLPTKSSIFAPNSPNPLASTAPTGVFSPSIFSPTLTPSTIPSTTNTLETPSESTANTTTTATPIPTTTTTTTNTDQTTDINISNNNIEEGEDIEEEEEEESNHVVKKLKVDNHSSINTFTDQEEVETEDTPIHNNGDTEIFDVEDEVDETTDDNTMMTDVNLDNSNNSTSTTTEQPLSLSSETTVQQNPPTLPQKRRLKKNNPAVPIPDNLVPPSQLATKPAAKKPSPQTTSTDDLNNDINPSEES
ncbi:hypothetical protein DLAC_00265 [Tieghemostelium lacteum]|uniref:Uncharacterized protein n=1 Tax=Tieghemostelium lacteum TaxID=361077 RepID=A0A152A9A2_TIELA|nr:hypothetical protein DLAC_00265 [Tieghemostelium lacteum]|eukprot:KYR02800.1 hypothetical protein DLAC_00265 [Tieghemostelium lacteum]